MTRRREQTPMPTGAELAILQVLWDRGPSTVREVHDALYSRDGAGYTTALKLLQVMHAKGLVARDDSERAHVFRPLASRENTQKRFLSDLTQRLFGGSASQLVLHALGDDPPASAAELAEIRSLLARLEKERRQ
jgi:BlaI family penicillinase repressor